MHISAVVCAYRAEGGLGGVQHFRRLACGSLCLSPPHRSTYLIDQSPPLDPQMNKTSPSVPTSMRKVGAPTLISVGLYSGCFNSQPVGNMLQKWAALKVQFLTIVVGETLSLLYLLIYRSVPLPPPQYDSLRRWSAPSFGPDLARPRPALRGPRSPASCEAAGGRGGGRPRLSGGTDSRPSLRVIARQATHVRKIDAHAADSTRTNYLQ